MEIVVSIAAQSLELFGDDGLLLRRYEVSTAKNGAGELSGSYRTPRGKHVIRARIGAGAPENTVFVRRRPTGEIWTPQLAADHPGRDWILTRILWLSGREPGFNRLGDIDTMRRYIYLHGSPDTVPMGAPGSIGCVRMRNRDIIELFDLVPCYCPVRIVEFALQVGDWAQLSNAAALLRHQVFVDEQKVPVDLELDEHDATATHVLACGPDGSAIGTARLLAEGEVARIGRMAVLPPWRRHGVGTALLRRLLRSAVDGGFRQVELSAQCHAVPFYARHGFVAEGDTYLDASIPHLTMRRPLNPGGN